MSDHTYEVFDVTDRYEPGHIGTFLTEADLEAALAKIQRPADLYPEFSHRHRLTLNLEVVRVYTGWHLGLYRPVRRLSLVRRELDGRAAEWVRTETAKP